MLFCCKFIATVKTYLESLAVECVRVSSEREILREPPGRVQDERYWVQEKRAKHATSSSTTCSMFFSSRRGIVWWSLFEFFVL